MCLKGRSGHLFGVILYFFILGSWPLKFVSLDKRPCRFLHPSATGLCLGRLQIPSLSPGDQNANMLPGKVLRNVKSSPALAVPVSGILAC